jgi:hypothetical protein
MTSRWQIFPVSRQTIKPAIYVGSGPWLDYHAHFEACAKLSTWNYMYHQRKFNCFLQFPFEKEHKVYWVTCQRVQSPIIKL